MYVILGATGNIGSRIVSKLIEKGKSVRMIARNEDKMKDHVVKGAEASPGSVNDAEFLTEAFRGATAVFTMIPPDYTAENARAYQNQVGQAITTALLNNKIKYVVNLSSVGAHLEEKAGIVQGLADMEIRLNQVKDLNVVHLRAAYFMENIFNSLDAVKQMNMMVAPLKGDLKMPMVATRDIADVATEYLLKLDFGGKQVRYLLGPRDVSHEELASLLAQEMGQKDLRYQQISYEDTRNFLTQRGVSNDTSDAFVELMEGINEGRIYEDSTRNSLSTTKTDAAKFVKYIVPHFKRH